MGFILFLLFIPWYISYFFSPKHLGLGFAWLGPRVFIFLYFDTVATVGRWTEQTGEKFPCGLFLASQARRRSQGQKFQNMNYSFPNIRFESQLTFGSHKPGLISAYIHRRWVDHCLERLLPVMFSTFTRRCQWSTEADRFKQPFDQIKTESAKLSNFFFISNSICCFETFYILWRENKMNFKIPKVLPSEFYQIRLRETGLSTRTNQRENTLLWWFGKHNVDILFLSSMMR